MSTPLVSVVIPAYNARPFIADTIAKIKSCFQALPVEGEIIVVDDGSSDGLAEAIGRDPDVRLFTFGINQGKGAAIREGFLRSMGQVVLFTDADLPYGVDPVGIALYYIKERGYQAVIGDRTFPSSAYSPAVPLSRRFLSSLCSLFVRTLLIGGIADTQCGFKAFQGDVARELSRMTIVDRFATDIEILYLLLRYRLEIRRIPVKANANGSSTVRAFRDSLTAVLDVMRVRLHWALGRYTSPVMVRISRESLNAVERAATAWFKSESRP